MLQRSVFPGCWCVQVFNGTVNWGKRANVENMTQLFPMLTKTQVCSSEIILPLKGPKLKFMHAKLLNPTDL